MKLLEELKRRNVFRVSIGYLISAWLVSQAADFGFDLIGAPDWVVRAIVLVLALGFPIVVFFAWAYEVTPEGIKKESEINRDESITHVTGKKLDRAIMVMLVLALGYFIWESRFAPGTESTPPQAEQVAESTTESVPRSGEVVETERQSIAVLPFENRSNLADDQFFTDGIHDDLITTLAKIGSMKVISRTSVMEYRDTTKRIPQIADELGVAHVLEGGIQRAGKQVRINVQLLDARTDEHLWAEIFDRELTAENLFAIQSEISNRIAEALQTALTPDEQERLNTMPTDNLAAYEAYRRGKQLMAMRRVDELEQATREFEAAVTLDPEFALAWVGVADSHYLWANYAGEDVVATTDKRQQAVDRALEIDPGLGEAWVSQASIYEDREQTEEAEAAYKKAIELSPNYATAYQWYGISLNNDITRSRERLVLAYKAIELDPRSLIIKAALVDELVRQGHYSQAEQQARDVMALAPDFRNIYSMMGNHYQWNVAEYAKALVTWNTLFELNTEDPDPLRRQVSILVEVGDFEAARKLQQKIIEIDPEHVYANWLDFINAVKQNNKPALRESLPWLTSQIEEVQWLEGLLAYVYFILEAFSKTREIYLRMEPGWLEPESWEMALRQNPGQGCFMSWLFLNTGDEELGAALLEKSLDFHENRVTVAVEHADEYSPDICYISAGQYDKALASLETQVEEGAIFTMGSNLKTVIYDPIRDDPRFIALQQERLRKTEHQRGLIDQMRARGELEI